MDLETTLTLLLAVAMVTAVGALWGLAAATLWVVRKARAPEHAPTHSIDRAPVTPRITESVRAAARGAAQAAWHGARAAWRYLSTGALFLAAQLYHVVRRVPPRDQPSAPEALMHAESPYLQSFVEAEGRGDR